MTGWKAALGIQAGAAGDLDELGADLKGLRVGPAGPAEGLHMGMRRGKNKYHAEVSGWRQ